MIRQGPFLIAAAALLWPAPARAIPVPCGSLETISHLSDLPAAARQALKQELKADLALGYFHRSFHVFFCPLWTWGGQHVLYAGDRYWPITEAQAARFLDHEGGLGSPFLYKFPLGLLILSGLVFCFALSRILARRENRKVMSLLNDPHYRHAIEIVVRPTPDEALGTPESPTAPSPAEPSLLPDHAARYQTALDYLKGRGIRAEEARANLDRVLQALAADAARGAST
jgi:hypothetical protein